MFLEDAVSIAGDVIAFAALVLNQVTGSSVPQGVAAVLTALVMIRVSLRLIQRSHLGPGRIWIVARVDVDDDQRGAQVTSLVRGIESGLKQGAEDVYRVDVVPIGAEQSAAPTHSSAGASPRRAG